MCTLRAPTRVHVCVRLQTMRGTMSSLEQQVEESKAGLRMRRPGEQVVQAAAKVEDVDDLTTEPPGFPLWQVVLVALIMFLLGYFANVVLGA